MKCSKCQKEMEYKDAKITRDDKGKEYKRELYWCRQDDIWITVETPTGKRVNLA